MLVSAGYRTIIARYVAKWGIAQLCLCETKYQGVSHNFGALLTSLKKYCAIRRIGVSTGVWCVPGFGAGFEIALELSELQKEGENLGKGHSYFLRQTLVCAKPWFKRDLIAVIISQYGASKPPPLRAQRLKKFRIALRD